MNMFEVLPALCFNVSFIVNGRTKRCNIFERCSPKVGCILCLLQCFNPGSRRRDVSVTRRQVTIGLAGHFEVKDVSICRFVLRCI